MQSVDYTTLIAAALEIERTWIPARIEQVYQRDRYTLSLALRTLKRRGWLTVCWHPEAARICLSDPPPRTPDTFTFSDQLRHQLKGLALIASKSIAPWERVIDLQFARRPGEEPLWHLYVEIMGKYSNVILTDGDRQIVTVAHQVSSTQSSVRPVQTGQPYHFPPPIVGTLPKLEESFARWQERVSLIPGGLKRQLLNSYRGLSPSVAVEIIQAAGLTPEQSTEDLSVSDWQALFKYWQEWLKILETGNFKPGWPKKGYTVLGWNITTTANSVQKLLNCYYTQEFNRQIFKQLHHQLMQKVNNLLKKMQQKADIFRQRLEQSKEAEAYRQKADLLMAYLQQWQPGLQSITLSDFETGKPIKIKLNPEKNAIQNAQSLYKNHQKLKRAKDVVKPLLQEVQSEIDYIEQVKASLSQLETDYSSEDLDALEEIRDELIQQNYLSSNLPDRTKVDSDSKPHRYKTPSGFELWIGRNNRQNDRLTFRTAGDYDLWFHTQEIPGSHLLLRLEPGAIPEEKDLQFSADLAAYYSQARQSEQVPVVYTEPKNVYKPKGAKPGMAIYKQERVIWGRPQLAKQYLHSI
ncbi:MAG: NFACT RNA binding domain-containing protein [Xenococcaceae cyanobacterium MO_188.B32]|nr:NFACT RNA binding domain-containing protein [Xenococcaceae cyanobacterium MO_188.B32]